MSDEGMRLAGPFGATISWERLSALKLHYFSLKRGRSRRGESDGWMQVTIVGDGRKVKFDSALEGFELVLKKAAFEAKARGVSLDETTIHNLRAIGVLPGEAA